MNIKNLFHDQRGSIMNVALLMLILITCIVAYGVMSSRTDVKIVSNERMRKMAFYAAEAGIETGRAMLDTLRKDDPFNWDNLLANNVLVDLGGGRQLIGQPPGTQTLDQAITAADPNGLQVGPAVYTLQVTDNNDYDGSSMTDTDETVILTSTGTWNNATATVQTVVSFTRADDFPKGGNQEFGNEGNR